MFKLLLAFSALALSSCILNVLDTSDRLDRKNGIILDTQKNRNFRIASYERTLAQESKGVPPPPSLKSWNRVWDNIFHALRDGSEENAEFYVNYIKQRRKELGLPR
jgi:hypothetical protein